MGKKLSALYLTTYQEQDRQHKFFRVIYQSLAILAFLIPPVSLIFTIQATILDSKKKSFDLWGALGCCILFALVPIASGFMSWNLINKLEENRRESDEIQKATFTSNEFHERKQYFNNVKSRMINLGVILKETKPDDSEKINKITIWNEDRSEVDVYMDRAQKDRQSKLLEYGIVFFYELRNKLITEEKAIEKISDGPLFFKQKHAESKEIVKQLETRYEGCTPNNSRKSVIAGRQFQ